jgi:hypothetical protein
MTCTTPIRPIDATSATSAAETEVLRQLRLLRFGQVTATVHDGRIVQIDRVERLRTGSRHHQFPTS